MKRFLGSVLVGGAGLALGVGLCGQTVARELPRARHFAVITSNEFLVDGEIVQRTEVGFTVMSRGSELTTVWVSKDTSITKGAETIRLREVGIGERVSVTAKRAADGKLVAVNVTVHTPSE